MVAIFLEGGGGRVAEKLERGDEGESVAGSVDKMIPKKHIGDEDEGVVVAVTILTSA